MTETGFITKRRYNSHILTGKKMMLALYMKPGTSRLKHACGCIRQTLQSWNPSTNLLPREAVGNVTLTVCLGAFFFLSPSIPARVLCTLLTTEGTCGCASTVPATSSHTVGGRCDFTHTWNTRWHIRQWDLPPRAHTHSSTHQQWMDKAQQAHAALLVNTWPEPMQSSRSPRY